LASYTLNNCYSSTVKKQSVKFMQISIVTLTAFTLLPFMAKREMENALLHSDSNI